MKIAGSVHVTYIILVLLYSSKRGAAQDNRESWERGKAREVLFCPGMAVTSLVLHSLVAGEGLH